MAVLGTEEEDVLKAKKASKLEQKKLREGKVITKAPGGKGGQKVIDTTSESLAELEVIEEKQKELIAEAPATSSETKSPLTKHVHIRSAAYKIAKTQINAESTYPLSEALDLLKKVSLTKFDPTVELHVTLKNKGFSKEIELPNSTGKDRKVAIADDATIAMIEAGKMNFDVLLASPAQMGKLVKLAKILGPRGLMPNPKNHTVVANPEETAKSMAGKNSLHLKTEKDTPVVHTSVGKLSQAKSQITENITAVLSSLPVGETKKVILKSTMSPAIKLQF